MEEEYDDIVTKEKLRAEWREGKGYCRERAAGEGQGRG